LRFERHYWRAGRALQFLRHEFKASDGFCYVTKFQNNPQHIRMLANEMLATNLGLALGLPMPRVGASPAMTSPTRSTLPRGD